MIDRRMLIKSALGTAALSMLPLASARAAGPIGPAYGKVVFEGAFARIEDLGDGVFAVVSTPLKADKSFGDLRTLCNGGLILGDDELLAIDGFFRPEGAAWLSDWAQETLGRRPSKVIVTHFHADHSGGLAGYQRGAEGPQIIMTETTRKLVFENYGVPRPLAEGADFAQPAIRVAGPTHILPDDREKTHIDLGGRKVRLHHLKGHTPSDVAIHVEGTPVIFAGDLVWQGLFHNYVNAIPSHLKHSVGHLLKNDSDVIVTGHGGVATAQSLANYPKLLAHVEAGAKQAHAAGLSAEEGAKDFTIPTALGEWHRFNPAYYETAFKAWYRELDA